MNLKFGIDMQRTFGNGSAWAVSLAVMNLDLAALTPVVLPALDRVWESVSGRRTERNLANMNRQK